MLNVACNVNLNHVFHDETLDITIRHRDVTKVAQTIGPPEAELFQRSGIHSKKQ